ncbi:uncharacterized protein LOC126371654 [Pectinophora gossypiella]|uniref:uncharacterized protein LOC126371654 n=1 Tax=Pectinophora gossypiella TaxID=13191 RepID=UPI00214F0ABF|nr:uncharacterized protein LOC126371654 [Pectinophora gossypiella]
MPRTGTLRRTGLPHTVSHCHTLCLTATHCVSLPHTVPHCHTLTPGRLPQAPARGAALRGWREACACALAAAAAARAGVVARALQHHAPLNAYLALLSAGVAVAWRAGFGADRALWLRGESAPTELAALAALLPTLLRAADEDWPAHEAASLERAIGRVDRVCGAAGGALLGALRLEAAARAAAEPAHALTRLLARAPHYKWALLRGAALCAAGAEAPELALQRRLRLHALPDELQPLPAEGRHDVCDDYDAIADVPHQ